MLHELDCCSRPTARIPSQTFHILFALVFLPHRSPLHPTHSQTHEPLRGIFDAIFRPDAPPDFNSAPVDVAAIAGSTIVQNTDPSTAAHNNSQDNSERKEQRQQQAEQPATDPDRNTPIRMEGTGVDLQRDERKQPREGGIQEVSHRSSMTSTMIRPFLPDERLTLEEAVWMYTTGGAIAAGMETRVGVIRPGFLADLTILELGCGSGPGLLENPRFSSYNCPLRLFFRAPKHVESDDNCFGEGDESHRPCSALCMLSPYASYSVDNACSCQSRLHCLEQQLSERFSFPRGV